MRHSLSRILPYTPDQLFTLVGDVERYPEFVPWIVAMRTWNPRQGGEGIDLIDAEAQVRFSVLSERFSTSVRRDAGARQINVALLRGPFKRLENQWRFAPHPHGTAVEFEIDFEFKIRILDRFLHANFDHAVNRLIGCFETRAKALYAEA